MKIKVMREACCSQDDQLGPLEKVFDVPDDCTLHDLLGAVTASRFLQFSSTHDEMSCRVAGEKAATVFSPHAISKRSPLFEMPPDRPIGGIAPTNEIEIEFVFDRLRVGRR